ncbi:MAG: hypothetical protein ACRDRU_09035 [Pseudonocardiaceae bacterium]
MSLSVHATLYRVFGAELSELLDTVLAGEVVSDRATAERLVRSVGALAYLHERHTIDKHGRCGQCWQAPRRWRRPWPKRSTCSVHAALSFFLRQPDDFVLTALRAARP